MNTKKKERGRNRTASAFVVAAPTLEAFLNTAGGESWQEQIRRLDSILDGSSVASIVKESLERIADHPELEMPAGSERNVSLGRNESIALSLTAVPGRDGGEHSGGIEDLGLSRHLIAYANRGKIWSCGDVPLRIEVFQVDEGANRLQPLQESDLCNGSSYEWIPAKQAIRLSSARSTRHALFMTAVSLAVPREDRSFIFDGSSLERLSASTANMSDSRAHLLLKALRSMPRDGILPLLETLSSRYPAPHVRWEACKLLVDSDLERGLRILDEVGKRASDPISRPALRSAMTIRNHLHLTN